MDEIFTGSIGIFSGDLRNNRCVGVSCSPWEEPWELVAATKNGRLLSMSFCWPGQGWMKHDRRVSLAYGGERIIQFLQPDPSTWRESNARNKKNRCESRHSKD